MLILNDLDIHLDISANSDDADTANAILKKTSNDIKASKIFYVIVLQSCAKFLVIYPAHVLF